MSEHKILISDQVSQACTDALNSKGFQVAYLPGLPPEELLEKIDTFHGLIVRSATKVTEQVIRRGVNLKIIGRAGVGTDNIDIAAASRQGIAVVNAAGANTISAAEHTIALMLALAREIPRAHISMLNLKWRRNAFTGVELYEKTLGLIGLGKIGRAVAERAGAFGMQILAYDPLIEPEAFVSAGVVESDLENLLRVGDFISVHAPLNDETRHMIAYPKFDVCKSSLRIVNTSRGGIIDESALYEALANRKIAGAALDVFEQEPPGDHKLFGLDNVITTPHLGAGTKEAQERVGVEIAQVVSDVLLEGKTTSILNAEILHLSRSN